MAKDSQGGSEKIEITMIPKNDRDFIEHDFKVLSSEKLEGYVEQHSGENAKDQMTAVMDDALSDYYKLNIQLIIKRSNNVGKKEV